jgi:hypothetical protein
MPKLNITAEALRSQRKPNEDTLVASKNYRNEDQESRNSFLPFRTFAYFAVRNKFDFF